MATRVANVDLRIMNAYLRTPFRFGIATVTALPHLFVRIELDVDGARSWGIASDNLPSKWFTKRADAPYREELAEMIEVVARACGFAREVGDAPSVYDLWQRVYATQAEWARDTSYPPLLWAFGVTLVERALISAFCRLRGMTLHQALRTNALGIRLGDHYPELAGAKPADILPERPLGRIAVRHTVGLGDPLADDDTPGDARLNDGLPQALDASIRAYGLTLFKIKLWGDEAKDLEWLRRVAAVTERSAGRDYAYTLDGNENYHEVEPFRALWESLQADRSLASFLSRLLFAEQSPIAQVHRMPDTPYLIVHGDNDESVSKRHHSDRLVAAMRRRGLSVDYVEVPGMGHGGPLPAPVIERCIGFVTSVF